MRVEQTQDTIVLPCVCEAQGTIVLQCAYQTPGTIVLPCVCEAQGTIILQCACQTRGTIVSAVYL